MRRIVALLVVMSLAGCANLIIREDDNLAQKTGKVALRTVGCVATIWLGCASEWSKMEDVKRQERYNAWFASLPPDAQERELDRRAAIAAALLPSLLSNSLMLDQPYYSEPRPYYSSSPYRSTTCLSHRSFDTTYTHCY